jgi:hypothetical protein
MKPMSTTSVIAIGDRQDRSRRVGRAVSARRRLDSARGGRRERERRGGRVWVNGQELGGPDPRYAHLALSFD